MPATSSGHERERWVRASIGGEVIDLLFRELVPRRTRICFESVQCVCERGTAGWRERVSRYRVETVRHCRSIRGLLYSILDLISLHVLFVKRIGTHVIERGELVFPGIVFGAVIQRIVDQINIVLLDDCCVVCTAELGQQT